MFVPGIDERKVKKSTVIEADTVILDLEDSVPPNLKEAARGKIVELLEELDWGDREVCVRVNPLSTLDAYRDLAVIGRLELDCIVLPKAETPPRDVYRATGIEVIAMIETPRGLLNIEEIASSEGVTGITWGPADLALHIGGMENVLDDSDYLRIAVAVTAAAYDVDPIDKVYFNINDPEGFKLDALKAKRLGYVGKMVIHPNQVTLANQIFTPSREEVEWAKRVVKAYEDAVKRGIGAVSLEGKLVDAVHYKLAKKLLERIGKR